MLSIIVVVLAVVVVEDGSNPIVLKVILHYLKTFSVLDYYFVVILQVLLLYISHIGEISSICKVLNGLLDTLEDGDVFRETFMNDVEDLTDVVDSIHVVLVLPI